MLEEGKVNECICVGEFAGEADGAWANGGAAWSFVSELMFRWGVSYSAEESCQ